MKFMSTSDDAVANASKTLLYADAGWGKTRQAIHMQKRFGRGLVFSGESGLRTLMYSDIEYAPFTSWDGDHDGATVFSFKGLCRMLVTPEFKAMGFKWIMVDSLTELSDRLYEHLEKHPEDWQSKKGEKNKFELYALFGSQMIGALKFLRDQPYHFLVTALQRTTENDNGATEYLPAVKGGQTQRQILGIFDNVLAGVGVTEIVEDQPKMKRFVCTQQIRGRHAKVRDPLNRLPAYIECDDVTKLFDMMEEQPAKKTFPSQP